MTARPVVIEDIRTADLAGLGRFFDLTCDDATSVYSAGAGFTDRYTAEPLLTGSGHLGMTSVAAAPAEVARMERHLYTSEALFCMGEPIVVPVAPADAAPRTSAVRALLVRPGQGLVLSPGVWHAPCLGYETPTAYYWFAEVDESIETEWVEPDAGPVLITHGFGGDHVE